MLCNITNITFIFQLNVYAEPDSISLWMTNLLIEDDCDVLQSEFGSVYGLVKRNNMLFNSLKFMVWKMLLISQF